MHNSHGQSYKHDYYVTGQESMHCLDIIAVLGALHGVCLQVELFFKEVLTGN
jgi:hypothetical protein